MDGEGLRKGYRNGGTGCKEAAGVRKEGYGRGMNGRE